MHAALTVLFLAGAASFAWIAACVFITSATGLDEPVGAFVRNRSTPALTVAMKVITVFGSLSMAPALAMLALAAIRWPSWRAFAVPLLAASAGAGVLDQLLKHLLPRARPVPLFGVPPSGLSSFPSGHALFALSLYGTLAWLAGLRLAGAGSRACVWAGAILLILAIGLSRIYLGLHYATDVLAGYAAGLAWVSVVLMAAGGGRARGTGPADAAGRATRTREPR